MVIMILYSPNRQSDLLFMTPVTMSVWGEPSCDAAFSAHKKTRKRTTKWGKRRKACALYCTTRVIVLIYFLFTFASVCLCMCLFVCRLTLFEFECRLLVPLAVRTTLDLNLPHWTWAVTDRSSCSLTSLPHLDTASQHVSLAHKTSFEYFTFLFFATDPVGAESRHCRTSTRNRVLYLCPSLTDRMWSLWTYTDHQSLPH